MSVDRKNPSRSPDGLDQATNALWARPFGKRPMPPLLRELVAVAGEIGDFFSGHIELAPSDGATMMKEAGFKSTPAIDTELRDRLVLFATEPDGSQYGLWLDAKTPPDEAPVVYVSSEGADDSVIAGNLGEFVSLMLIDRDDVGMFPDVPREKDEAHSPGFARFAAWAKKRGITKAKTPAKLVAKARRAHPPFDKWLDAIREKIDPSRAPKAKRGKAAGAAKEKAAKPVSPEIPDTGVLTLELVTDMARVERGVAEYLEAFRKRVPQAQLKTGLRMGLTDVRDLDFSTQVVFPSFVPEASELRIELPLATGAAKLIVEPPRKGEHKEWWVQLWMAHHPLADLEMRAALVDFERVFSEVGKVKLRRGNAKP